VSSGNAANQIRAVACRLGGSNRSDDMVVPTIRSAEALHVVRCCCHTLLEDNVGLDFIR
jgi:hypothetical protein